MSDIEEIKNRINIEELISDYIELKKAGVNFRAICPFHEEKTPSFVVSPSKDIWHCFGCGRGGDIFEFVKEHESVDFPEALNILASRAGVEIQKRSPSAIKQQDKNKVYYEINDWAGKFFHKVLLDSSKAEKAREYLKKRDLTDETIESWQIGFAPDDFHTLDKFITKKGYQKKEGYEAGVLSEKNGDYFDRFRGRVMFPIRDRHGRVVAFVGRVLEEKEGVGKYVNSPETPIYKKSEVVFGLDRAKNSIRKADRAVVVEGNMDVITAHQAGFENVVASSGTALTEKQLQKLDKFTENLTFAFDVDEAGLSAAKRGVAEALKQGFNVDLLVIPKSLGKDPDDIIRESPEKWKELLSSTQNFLDFYFNAIFDKIDLGSNTGKKQAIKELLPIISYLPSPVDRSHFIHELASRLSVSEQVLFDVLNQTKDRPEKPADETKTKPAGRKLPKLEILEKRVLGLLLKFYSRLTDLWKEFDAEDFTNTELKGLFTDLKEDVSKSEFDLQEYIKRNSEFGNQAQLLIFGLENELELMDEWDLETLKSEIITDLRREQLKQKMNDLSRQIENAERQGDQDQLENLFHEFHHLSKELSKYHGEKV